jgi:signal transduction histidine kinase
MNPAGLAMVEADSIDMVRGLQITEVIAPEHRAAFMDLHRRVFEGESGALEFEIIGVKGRRRWLSTHAVPLRDGSGAVQALLGITRDVTETRRAEEQLRASRTALRSLATRQQDIREDERTRIAREIHDSLGQALTALKLQLAAAQDAASPESPALGHRLAETALMVDDLVKIVRRIATELRPPILDQLGLPAALEWLAHDFTRRTGIRCEPTIMPTDDVISDELGTALFRIVQEGLTNISRHADASHVQIALGVKSHCVTLEISDDGRGITEAATTGPGSLGILGMRERAAALGGVLEVAPRGDGGTRVTAWFPPLPATASGGGAP